MTLFSQGSSAHPLSDCHALLSRCSLQAGCYVTSVQGASRESERKREEKPKDQAAPRKRKGEKKKKKEDD